MEVAITEIEKEIDSTKDEISFIKNFERPYLGSEWADYYLGHENGVIYEWEWVIRLRNRSKFAQTWTPDDILSLQEKKEDVIVISSPEESWYYFIYDKLKPLKELWIIE